MPQVLELSVARDQSAEGDETTFEGVGEGERRVKIGERAVDQTDAAEGVRSCEVRRRQGGHVQSETMRSGKFEER